MADLNHEERARRWSQIAVACGLENVRVERLLWYAQNVQAEAGPLQVALTPSSRPLGVGSVIVNGVAPGLATAARFAEGDPWPRVGGPPLVRAALFDPLTRRLVEGLLDSRIEGANGHVRDFACTVRIASGALFVDHEDPLSPDALSAIVEIARRLVEPPSLAPAVADVLRRETDAACRLHALQALHEQAPDHPATDDATRACLTDPAPEVRLLAALSHRDGRPVLRELAASPDAADRVSAHAVEALGADIASTALSDVLRAAVARRRPLAATACIEALAARGDDDGLVDAVGSADARIALPAAGALGRVGAAAGVVVALREAEVRHSGDRAVRNAARIAVAAVQARLQGAGAGQLSVASPDAGTLALADDARGRLTVPLR
ncbi:MAG: hypothetical protein ABW221_00735 [Vicinamibacteria bacterium]